MRKTLILFSLLSVVAMPRPAASQDIVETAAAAGSFGTLVAAVEAAGLVEALKAEGPFTVFAPSDEAFAKLPEGTVENLLRPENVDQLRAVLTLHVVSGAVMAAAVTDGLEAETLNGEALRFSVDDTGARVGAARIVATDVAADNGVIHVIDTVLLPSGD